MPLLWKATPRASASGAATPACSTSTALQRSQTSRVKTIERLADQFAAADGAFATTRVGVQTSHNTTLTEWAVQTLNAITANVDRPGGSTSTRLLRRAGVDRRVHQEAQPSTVAHRKIPQIFGGPPATVFADDVLSDDPDRIRALVVVAGNPVITFPNTAKVEEALRRLDLLVCIDLYLSDTATFGHYALPATTLYEKGGLHFLTSTFEPFPFVEWKPKVVEPRGEARTEWRIFKDLSREAHVPLPQRPDPRLGVEGGGVLRRRLQRGLALPFPVAQEQDVPATPAPEARRAQDRGYPVGTVPRAGPQDRDCRIHLAPPEFVAALPQALSNPITVSEEYPFLLISGARRLAGYNSWTHNIPALMEKMKGNWATLSPADAERLHIRSGDRVRLTSAVASVEIGAVVSQDIREGVIAVHQFWGHTYDSGMRTSRRHPGVNVNFLHDDRVRDCFCGMPVYNATPCRVEVVERRSQARSS